MYDSLKLQWNKSDDLERINIKSIFSLEEKKNSFLFISIYIELNPNLKLLYCSQNVWNLGNCFKI